MKRKLLKIFIGLAVFTALVYGVGRLYYAVTDGFTIANITSDFKTDSRWQTHELTLEEKQRVDQVLAKPFYYLGKGCQSYVFYSEDGEYVIKFFKYHRFRNKPWLEFFRFIPPVGEYREKALVKKQKNLDALYSSWKIGFDELRAETGLLFVHLNKSDTLQKNIVIFDKMGRKHTLDADKMEFLVQKRAKMLCPSIDEWMANGEEVKTKLFLTRLVKMIENEYLNGFADTDHALMQNTGVYEGLPVHVDVGQFIKNNGNKNPDFYTQEMYNKMYKFRLWLLKNHPTLVTHLDNELVAIIGEKFHTLKYIPKVKE